MQREVGMLCSPLESVNRKCKVSTCRRIPNKYIAPDASIMHNPLRFYDYLSEMSPQLAPSVSNWSKGFPPSCRKRLGTRAWSDIVCNGSNALASVSIHYRLLLQQSYNFLLLWQCNLSNTSIKALQPLTGQARSTLSLTTPGAVHHSSKSE